MIEYLYDLEQGDSEWLESRRGLITSSVMCRILTPTLKVADNEDSRDIVYELLAQRISGYVEPTYINDAMLRGHVDEIEARTCYTKNIAEVKECGLITNDKLGFKLAYSPDGLIGDDGLIEVKSRKQSLHIKNILDGEAEKKTMIQMQFGLFVSERKYIEFISYCGGLPVFIKRCEVDEKYQEAIKQACISFEFRINALKVEYSNASKGMIKTERKILINNGDFE